ncbi:MAG: apolipoprotein N-acyltransferase [Myxococcota bacterium]|jgi:apolipoprotein N-acyltransferase|nr:apolipoprotein N-acyltransferase [Myxococcota bacterium]
MTEAPPSTGSDRIGERRALLIALVAVLVPGLGINLVSPPINWAWLHWVLYLPLLVVLDPGRGRRNAWLGYLSAWIGLATLFFWLAETVVRFSNLPMALAYVVVLLFATLFAVPGAIIFGAAPWLRARLGIAWVFALPALAVACEHLYPFLFPYFVGVVHYRTPWVWQLASVLGAAGLSFLVYLVNAALAEAWLRHRERRRPPWVMLAIVAGIFVANLGFGAWRHGRVEEQLQQAPEIRVALLQQNTTMEERLSAPAHVALKSWIKLTRKILPLEPDLVVWPEGSVPFNPVEGASLDLYSGLAQAGEFDLLLGGGTIEGADTEDYEVYNSSYLVNPQGAVVDRYDKMVLMPFGEYIPFADRFPFILELIQGPGNFTAGERATVFETEHGSFTSPICYEGILTDQMWALRDADFIVNGTNDAWYGDTKCPHQHSMLVAVQAMQLGRPLLRVAYTGISFVVEPHGEIRYETEPFTDAAKVEVLRRASMETLYSRGGRHFPWLCVLVAVSALIRARSVTPQGDSS